MGLHDAYEKALLDWVLGGAAAARPGGRWLSFATGSPNAAGASDGAFTPRCTVTFGVANSPGGGISTSTNRNAISATGTGVGAATAIGWNLYESSVGGARLMFGTFTAAIGCKSADNPALSAGTLRITLA